jgi:hypothetical protein
MTITLVNGKAMDNEIITRTKGKEGRKGGEMRGHRSDTWHLLCSFDKLLHRRLRIQSIDSWQIQLHFVEYHTKKRRMKERRE